MAAMGGSEMAWGLVMALWLTGMAVGARSGVRLGSTDIAGLLPIVVLVLAGAGVVLLRAAPAVIGAAPGETVTTASAVWLWFLAIVPAAVAGGFAFPALANTLGPKGGGTAYASKDWGRSPAGSLSRWPFSTSAPQPPCASASVPSRPLRHGFGGRPPSRFWPPPPSLRQYPPVKFLLERAGPGRATPEVSSRGSKPATSRSWFPTAPRLRSMVMESWWVPTPIRTRCCRRAHLLMLLHRSREG